MSFEDFYQQTFKASFRFYYYKSVHFDNIEDLVQESYMRFYSKFEHKLDLSEFLECKKILLGICLNVYREWVRNNMASFAVEFVDEYEYEVEADSFDEYLSSSFEQERTKRASLLRKMINDLNPSVKKVIELRYFESKTRKQISEILGISEDQVHTYQKRGLKYLKNALETESN